MFIKIQKQYVYTVVLLEKTVHNFQLNQKEMHKGGVTTGYVRLSIGIENVNDVISDIDNSLKII